jgi:hypothetical protein
VPLSHEFGAELAVEISRLVAAAAAVDRGVLGRDLAAPFRAQEVLDRSHLLGLDLVGIDEDQGVDGAEQPQNVAPLRIDERQFSRFPFGAVGDLGQDQER